MGKLLMILLLLTLSIVNIPFWYYFSHFGPEFYTSIGWIDGPGKNGELIHWPSMFMCGMIQMVFIVISWVFGESEYGSSIGSECPEKEQKC